MTDSTPNSLPPSGQAGYFPDPDDQRYERYFDGQRWTKRRVLIEQLPETGPHPHRDQGAPAEQRRKPSFGNIAAPGAPPPTMGRDASGGGSGGDYFSIMGLLRKLFGDYRDPRQR